MAVDGPGTVDYNKEGKTTGFGEICTQGEEGSEEEWIVCGPTEKVLGTVCIHHKKNDQDQNIYTVTHGFGVPGKRASVENQAIRESDADSLVSHYENFEKDCTRSSINAPRDQYSSSFTYTCNLRRLIWNKPGALVKFIDWCPCQFIVSIFFTSCFH